VIRILENVSLICIFFIHVNVLLILILPKLSIFYFEFIFFNFCRMTFFHISPFVSHSQKFSFLGFFLFHFLSYFSRWYHIKIFLMLKFFAFMRIQVLKFWMELNYRILLQPSTEMFRIIIRIWSFRTSWISLQVVFVDRMFGKKIIKQCLLTFVLGYSFLIPVFILEDISFSFLIHLCNFAQSDLLRVLLKVCTYKFRVFSLQVLSYLFHVLIISLFELFNSLFHPLIC